MTGHSFYAPDFAVKVSGLTLEADVRSAVRSLTYDNNIDTADMFTLQLNNADMRLTDSALFDIGKSVEIHMGYAGKLSPMMLGEITAVSPSFPESGAPNLSVTGYDKSQRMRHNSPPHKTFKYVNDSLIAAQIAVENGLIPIVDPALTFREQIDQNGSDWALLQELADRNHFQVFVNWDKLYFRFPRPQTELVVLEWGRNLNSFKPRISSAGQTGIQEVRGYDYELAQTIVAVVPAIALDTDLDDIIERLGSGFVERLVGLGRYVVRGVKVSDHFEAVTFAKSMLQQILEGLYEGSGACIGIPELRAGELIEIRGIGKRFSGKYRLSRVTHTIDESGYRTSFEVTQKASGLLLQSLRNKLIDAPSPKNQPKIEGVKIGIVRNNLDPKNLGRVKVSFPDFSEVNQSRWARVASFMAGGSDDPAGSKGNYFLPDIDDEVLVAFENGNLEQPVIIGSLWNSKVPPPETNKGQNSRKVLKTRSGMQIVFDETEGKEFLSISDKAGSSITLKADGSLSILAKGNIELKSTGGDISFEANNVKVNVTGTMDVN